MKCPKCGFVSYPGITQCKKCGHSFPHSKLKAEADQAASPPPPAIEPEVKSPVPAGEENGSPPAPSPLISPALTAPEPVEWEEPAETEPGLPTIVPEPPPSEPARPWREELNERVESYRQRRARLKKGFDDSSSLEFDFRHAPGTQPEAPLESADTGPQAMGAELDFELNHSRAPDDSALPLDDLAFEGLGEGSGILPQAEPELADELPPTPAGPVELVLDSLSAPDDEAREAAPISLPLAPMGRRFLGGMVDALVLLASSGLFALIYWRAGGSFAANLLNFTVAAFIGVVICLAYFGVFTALTSTTPGLLWMGIEVRSWQGNPPTTRQVLWRSFGYLVSASALLLGFVWALVDSDGLTWHDRMSDTYLASVEGMDAQQPSMAE